ncbi:MAG: prolipoprotein diacylglyceryl transferase [Clostridiales bacterium]|jgi:phosphatidylglycerol:prolipoprotein diacylglycerol transferase|nr:prolipoprotein diacylglyceryl transferase [Clostridiales bacterium]
MINNFSFALAADAPKLVDNVAFTVFGLDIYWYAIVITAGMVLALFLFFYLSKSIKLSQEDGITFFLICVPLGLIFARLFYIVSHVSEFFPLYTAEDFWTLLDIRSGGVTIIGGIAGGFFGGFLFAKKKKIKFLELLGTAAVPLLLGQAIGRWGNFFNQELFGPPVPEGATFFQHFPVGVYIDDIHAVLNDTVPGWHYSTVFFESILSVIGVVLLFLLFRKVKRKGTVLFGYLTWYFISRALVESIRVDAVFFGSMKISLGVLISIIIIPIAIVLGIVYFQNGTFKKFSFKKLPETVEVTPEESGAEAVPVDEQAAPVKNREKTASARLADFRKKYLSNKKKK